MNLRTLVFRLLPHCYQIVYGTPWTTAQADEAESLVAQIRALSIVARNGGGWTEPGREVLGDMVSDDEARRMLR